MKTFSPSILALLPLLLAGPVYAQPAAPAPVQAAQQYREELATAIARGGETAGTALAQLRQHRDAAGLGLTGEVDQAFAAQDIGHRLIAAGKPVEAELFFREAEKSLDQAVLKTPDTAAEEKARYLAKRALIRARYLGKRQQAKDDLDAAQKLRPDDQYLQAFRGSLGSELGERSKEQSPKG